MTEVTEGPPELTTRFELPPTLAPPWQTGRGLAAHVDRHTDRRIDGIAAGDRIVSGRPLNGAGTAGPTSATGVVHAGTALAGSERITEDAERITADVDRGADRDIYRVSAQKRAINARSLGRIG